MANKQSTNICLTLVIICMMFVISGCLGDKEPPTEKDAKEYLKERFAEDYDASYKFISAEKKADIANKKDVTIYKFESEFGFEFEVEAGLRHRDALGGYAKYYDDTYELELAELIESDAQNLIKQQGYSNLSVDIWGAYLGLDVFVDKYDDLEQVTELCCELYELYMYKYKIKDNRLARCTVSIKKGDERLEIYKSLKEVKESKDTTLEELRQLYLDKVRRGDIIDLTIDKKLLGSAWEI